MLEAFEERLNALTEKVEDLADEVRTLKKERDEEVTLIPGAEYDLVPAIAEKVIYRGVGRIVRVEKATHELGLSAREWAMFSADEDNHE